MSSTVEEPAGPSAVYLAARREWNERYGSYISRERWWRYTAVAAMTGLVVSGYCNAWQATQSRVKPYVVAVDQINQSVAVHSLDGAPEIPNPDRIRVQLAQWIVDVRTVSSDMLVVKKFARQALDWTAKTSDANAKLLAWYQANPPSTRAGQEKVGVQVGSVVRIGADTWQVDWTEDHSRADGYGTTKEYWRINVTVKIVPPTTDQELLVNWNGMYVTWFEWTQIPTPGARQ